MQKYLSNKSNQFEEGIKVDFYEKENDSTGTRF